MAKMSLKKAITKAQGETLQIVKDVKIERTHQGASLYVVDEHGERYEVSNEVLINLLRALVFVPIVMEGPRRLMVKHFGYGGPFKDEPI